MGMLEKITAKLVSKEFGNVKLYFDADVKRVRLVEQDDKYTYVIVKSPEGKFDIRAELAPRICLDCEIENLNRIWVIPNIEEFDNVKCLDKKAVRHDASPMLPSFVYQIISYTILEDEHFKNCLFSNSIISVIVMNGEGSKYAVPYLVDEGVRGCDGNPAGHIVGPAFQLEKLGVLTQDGKFIINL